VERLSQGLQNVMRSQETRAQLRRQGAEPASGHPGEFAALIRRELDAYRRLAKITGIKVD
jgi:tripartite-type tricarboxylate transporter receptor subunit TctC